MIHAGMLYTIGRCLLYLGLAALRAFKAGADLLLICKSHEKVISALVKTVNAIVEDPNLQERMHQSIRRVTVMRKAFAGSVLK